VAAAQDCIFCRIVAGEIPADVVRSGRGVIAFRDLNPQAPTHVLVVSRDHHDNVAALAGADPATLAEIVHVGAEVAAAEAQAQFRLVFNTGVSAGQTVFHVHAHVLGGRPMTWPPG
jgi:histidine triad (HIT) family protein